GTKRHKAGTLRFRPAVTLANRQCRIVYRWPLIRSRIASVVCKSGPVTHRLVVGSLLAYSIFCLTSARHRPFADSSYDSPVLRLCF
ncbi:hypothetical protein HAX54_051534, partial [Datura stramonium]|nr:hypothetical protein [Datura stramonium]